MDFSSWTRNDIDKLRDEIEGKTFLCGIFGRTTEGVYNLPTISVGLVEGDQDGSKQRLVLII